MSNQLAIYGQFAQIQQAAVALHQSGFFTDVKSQAQAIVKVMAGAELGLPPFASMTGINIIQGKPALSANAIATLVKNDPRYDYNLKTCNNQECIIEWFEDGKRRGESSFTMAEAQTAGLTNKDNWRKFPSDMLFARAMTRGARRFAPGIFGGSPIYTPEELGADTDENGFIDAEEYDAPETTPETSHSSMPEKVVQPKSNGSGRPLSPEALREAVNKKAEKCPDKISEGARGLMVGQLNDLFDGDENKRHQLTRYLFGVGTTKGMPGNFCNALLDWMKDFDMAKREATAVIVMLDGINQPSLVG